jgi:hypothetical protein
MEINYSIQIEGFAERHFIKSFQKKYKKHWDVTHHAITAEFERIDNLLLTDKAEIIIDNDNIKIIKTDFRVSGTKESAKKSGNRAIIAWNEKDKFVYILLVYSKTDLPSNNKETDEWKKLIKNNYPKYKHLF